MLGGERVTLMTGWVDAVLEWPLSASVGALVSWLATRAVRRTWPHPALSAARRLRVLHGRMEIHGVLWMVLVIGAVPTVVNNVPRV